jgi:uncharacterized damage-inducible protein DinB
MNAWTEETRSCLISCCHIRADSGKANLINWQRHSLQDGCMSSHLEADLSVIEELYDAMAGLVRQLDDDCLNWFPLSSDANSIAAMVTHTLGATDAWLARAVGETIDRSRDRDAEFKTRANSSDLVAAIERSRVEVRRRLGLLQTVDLAETFTVRRLSRNEDSHISKAWCIEHAIIHAGEHWGQIQLTRQLYESRQ